MSDFLDDLYDAKDKVYWFLAAATAVAIFFVGSYRCGHGDYPVQKFEIPGISRHVIVPEFSSPERANDSTREVSSMSIQEFLAKYPDALVAHTEDAVFPSADIEFIAWHPVPNVVSGKYQFAKQTFSVLPPTEAPKWWYPRGVGVYGGIRLDGDTFSVNFCRNYSFFALVVGGCLVCLFVWRAIANS